MCLKEIQQVTPGLFFFFTNHENTVLTKVVAEISEHINITKKMSDGARHMMMAVHADCLRHYI